jgi:hypothetical protein
MLVHAFDSILCVVQNAISATHERDKKMPCTPNVGYRACERGSRSCTRSIVFHAWQKRLKRPRMRGGSVLVLRPYLSTFFQASCQLRDICNYPYKLHLKFECKGNK